MKRGFYIPKKSYMKKILYVVFASILAVGVYLLSQSSNAENPYAKKSTQFNQEQQTENTYSADSAEDESVKTYIVSHEAIKETYTIRVDFATNKIDVLDEEGNYLSGFILDKDPYDVRYEALYGNDKDTHEVVSDYELPPIVNINFLDVNLDGYTDMELCLFESGWEREFYLWDSALQGYTPVNYDGFLVIHEYEVCNGFLRNWEKHSYWDGVIQTLVWDGNTLRLESEETYTIEE